jgi:hypothetical protein
MLAQPSPARSFIVVLPRNRVTANSHDALFHNAARFLDELLKQGAQVQLGSQFPVRQNGEGAIGFAIEVPADDFWRVAFRALLALRAAGSVAFLRTGCAMGPGWRLARVGSAPISIQNESGWPPKSLRNLPLSDTTGWNGVTFKAVCSASCG